MGCLLEELFYLVVVPGIVVGLMIAWDAGSVLGTVAVGGLGLLAIVSYLLATWENVREEGLFYVVVVPVIALGSWIAWEARGVVGAVVVDGLGLLAAGTYFLAIRERRIRPDRSSGVWPRALPNVDFSELRAFFGSYFHQDWKLDAPDDNGIIRLFLEDASEENVAAVRADIDSLLALGLSEAEMQSAVFWNLGCYYKPGYGITTTEWIRSVRARLG